MAAANSGPGTERNERSKQMKKLWYYDTDLGRFAIAEEDGAITDLLFAWQNRLPLAEEEETPLLKEAGQQLREYALGQRQDFDLPLAPAGTPFQQAAWQALLTIPYGETRSYGQMAAQIGKPKACRAVGMANNRNPIAVIIPCHRVIGANGSLVGYGGGLDLKARLLALESSGKGTP